MASANRKALGALVDLESAGRIRKLNGVEQLWPGLRIVPVGGHTPGLQILTVETENGSVVLASDALHFYENYERRRPVQVTLDFLRALEAFDSIEALAGGNLVVAGHDPADCSRFRQIADGILQIA